MPEYEITIVDSFTTERYAGNPCGVVTRAEGLTPAQMQTIARELNLSETAFAMPSEAADFRVRFFTPRKEIPLAGHPTIATMHALVEDGLIEVGDAARRVTQELNVGVLPVDLSRRDDGRVRIAMTQATPEFGTRSSTGTRSRGCSGSRRRTCWRGTPRRSSARERRRR